MLKASLEMEHREKLRIEKLNQMKLKFYINISHELRTPLTLMVSQVDLILQNYDLGGTFRGKLLKVRQYTVQMQQLITEVLGFPPAGTGGKCLFMQARRTWSFSCVSYSIHSRTMP